MACKPFGCYPPFQPPPSTLRPHSAAPRADIPLAKFVNSFVGGAGPHAAFRTTIFYLMDLGSSRCGEKPVALCFSQIVPLSRKTERKESIECTESTKGTKSKENTKNEKEHPPPQPQVHLVGVGTIVGRHEYSQRQGNCSQVLQGGYPPEGPMAEVLRAEAKTAGSNYRACKPRTHSAAPRPRVRARRPGDLWLLSIAGK